MGKYFFFGSNRPDSSFRGALPDPRESPQMAEFYANRKETSHSTVGMDAGDTFGYKGEGGVVEHEERDQHTGAVEQYVRTSDQLGSGTRRIRWEPDGPRTLVIKEDKRIFD